MMTRLLTDFEVSADEYDHLDDIQAQTINEEKSIYLKHLLYWVSKHRRIGFLLLLPLIAVKALRGDF